MTRPSFQLAWTLFSKVNVDVKSVGKLIGGKVKTNIDSGIFNNACPIRISYVLNYCGFAISNSNEYAMVSGSDAKWYIFRVNDMMKYLENTFGKPDVSKTGLPSAADFANKKGLLVVKGSGWSNARGHVTLWNGAACSDACHLAMDPDNGTFTPESAALWILP